MEIDWLSFIKPRLSTGLTVQQATAEYFRRHYPATYSAADQAAQVMLRSARSITIPSSSGYPDDGIALVVCLLEAMLAEN